jgi:hypothetical protein
MTALGAAAAAERGRSATTQARRPAGWGFWEVNSMLRLFLSASLGLALLISGVCSSGAAKDQPGVDPKSKTNPVVVIKLRIPTEAKYVDVEKLLDKAQAQEGTKLYLEVPKDGESFSAEVVAESLTPSKRVGAVVKELLDRGITKVSIEVKK